MAVLPMDACRPSPFRKTFLLLAAVVGLTNALPARADAPDPSPWVQFTTGLAGNQVQLSWVASPSLRYKIEKSTTLEASGDGAWSLRAVVSPMGPVGRWLDPNRRATVRSTGSPFRRRKFSRSRRLLLSPTGGIIDIKGQCIPDGSFLVLEIEGQPPLFVPLAFLAADTWRAVVTGTFVPGALVTSARVVNGSGVTLDTIDQAITITPTGLALDGPADMPPAAPVPQCQSNPVPGIGIIVKKHPPPDKAGASRMATGGVDEDCDGDCDDEDDSANPLGMAINEACIKRIRHQRDHPAGRAAYPSGLPGEVAFQTVDLAVASPAWPRSSFCPHLQVEVRCRRRDGSGLGLLAQHLHRANPLSRRAGLRRGLAAGGRARRGRTGRHLPPPVRRLVSMRRVVPRGAVHR